MSVDRTKVLQAAQNYLAKGNYDRAIAELRKIVSDHPSDVRTWLKIGDLYTRNGSRTEAIETYARVASQYGEQGFFLKAVAVYKQILKLDPTRLDVQLKLAEMYEMLQLISDALATYEHVAAGFARGGEMDRALDTLKKMTALDPENIPVRIKAAEALSKAGRPEEAAEEFEAGAALLLDQGRLDDYLKVAERLLYHRADDVNLARELAATYLERSDPKRALSKLQTCFKADPKDIATLELLAEAFNQLGQLPKTISVYKEVARIHQEANRGEERARVLKRILELDPGDREARQGLASFADGAQPASGRRDIALPASAVIAPSQMSPDGRSKHVPDDDDYSEPEIIEDIELLEDDEAEIVIVEDDEDLIEELEDIEVEELPRSVPPDVQREAQIARLLTECDVFMRYGLKQKVIEQLHAVLSIEPRHVEARERLKDLFIEEGRLDEAIAELVTLADVLAIDRSAAAALYLRQVLEIQPGHSQAVAKLKEMGASIPPPPNEGPALDELAPPHESAAPPEDDVFFIDDEATQDVVGAEDPSLSGPPSVTPELLTLDDEEVPTTAANGAPYEESPPIDRTVVAAPPVREAMVPPPGQTVGDPLAPMSPEEFDEVPLRNSSPGEVHAAATQRLSMPPGEVEETLDEADFFVAQGLIEEARAILKEASSLHPNNSLIGEKLREVEALAAQSEAAATSSSAEVDLDQSFELAEKLAEDFEDVEDTPTGSDVLDVEHVFAAFKKGVADQVGAEDTETHFDLGIAYKEMGLLDDAVNEFRLCLSNPARICIAETMIGLCHIEKGAFAEAISHFKKGLYAATKSDREELGLYFELGHAYELMHDAKEALYYYLKVQKRDATFRDVERRITNLSQPHAAAAESPPSLGLDDIDRAFDDLMGED